MFPMRVREPDSSRGVAFMISSWSVATSAGSRRKKARAYARSSSMYFRKRGALRFIQPYGSFAPSSLGAVGGRNRPSEHRGQPTDASIQIANANCVLESMAKHYQA